MSQDQDILKYMNKIKEIEKSEKVDLSSDEDLSIAVMNLISIEEHLFFTANKTKKNQYYEILLEVREMRKELLKRLVKDYEGEVWCISKHLLASSMRLFEVGTKLLNKNDKNANDLFKKSYSLYSLFWGLNLKLLPIDNIRDQDLLKEESDNTDSPVVSNKTILTKMGEVVKKAIDCCKE